MEYQYYDPPLDLFTYSNKPENRASLEDIKKLDRASLCNLDYHLAKIDYELHFHHSVSLVYGGNKIIEGPNVREMALCRGGSVACYRECLRRNLTVDQLFGLVGYRYPDLPPQSKIRYTSARTLEKTYLGDINGDFPENCTADDIPHEAVIVHIKKRREELLELKRQREEAQQH